MGVQERKRLKKIKEYVINRDGMICCYCDKVLTPETITMEHIVPDSKRGTFNSTNLTIACSEHNNKRGNKNFFDYAKQFYFSPDKIAKYKTLYYNNLKIKVLNIAKEDCLFKAVDEEDRAIPSVIIQQACQILKIKPVDFKDYESTYQFDIKFGELSERKRIQFCFEQLIRIIEADSE
jgi:hypothetical protein